MDQEAAPVEAVGVEALVLQVAEADAAEAEGATPPVGLRQRQWTINLTKLQGLLTEAEAEEWPGVHPVAKGAKQRLQTSIWLWGPQTQT